MTNEGRFLRQEALFGKEGQEKIGSTHVAIVGVGGIGTHEVQQLPLLGTQEFTLIEPQELDETNKNRYVGHRHDDPIPGTAKLEIARRTILAVNPEAVIHCVPFPIEAGEAEDALSKVDVVFGCLDHEAPRFHLNELAASLGKPLIDAATEIFPGEVIRYGGRVFVCWNRPGCLVCCNVLDMEEVNAQLGSEEERANRRRVYGIELDGGGSGPSVVSLNGTIASIAITEFMVAITGLRSPVRLTTYYGEQGRFTKSLDAPKPGCYTCQLAMRALEAS